MEVVKAQFSQCFLRQFFLQKAYPLGVLTGVCDMLPPALLQDGVPLLSAILWLPVLEFPAESLA